MWGVLFASSANKFPHLLAFSFLTCENAFIRPLPGMQTLLSTGLTVNTSKQPQMTSERYAPVLSLLAGCLSASRRGTDIAAPQFADATRLQHASHDHPVFARLSGETGKHAHHIRGGNP
jgi:hypothetical protein